MENLQKILRSKYQNQIDKVTKPKKRARIQVLTDRVYEQLGLGEDYKKYPLVCRLVKNNKEAHIQAALSWLADYPNKNNPLGLFMWKLKEIRNHAKPLS